MLDFKGGNDIMTLTIREPGSSLTHFAGMLLSMLAGIPLIATALATQNASITHSISIFIASMILLYGASATYHGVSVEGRKLRIFRKIDHIMIFILIAGSYTPVCVIALQNYYFLFLVWGIAILGIGIKAFWITCPKWFSSATYIALGWICVFMFHDIVLTLPSKSLFWLIAGGIIYTIGGILYALKLKIFNELHPNFGSHEIFHLFIMGGSFCHIFSMYYLIS